MLTISYNGTPLAMLVLPEIYLIFQFNNFHISLGIKLFYYTSINMNGIGFTFNDCTFFVHLSSFVKISFIFIILWLFEDYCTEYEDNQIIIAYSEKWIRKIPFPLSTLNSHPCFSFMSIQEYSIGMICLTVQPHTVVWFLFISWRHYYNFIVECFQAINILRILYRNLCMYVIIWNEFSFSYIFFSSALSSG